MPSQPSLPPSKTPGRCSTVGDSSLPEQILASPDPFPAGSRSRRVHSKSVSAHAKSFPTFDTDVTQPSKSDRPRSRPGSAVGKLACILSRASRSTASISQPHSPYDDLPPTPTSPSAHRSQSTSHSPAPLNIQPSSTYENANTITAGFKRLLKKPSMSLQLHSGGSSYSIPSDSEASSKFYSMPYSPGLSLNVTSPNDSMTTPNSFRVLQHQSEKSPSTPASASGQTSNVSSPLEQSSPWVSALPPRGPDQKPHNVLRRKPSGSYKLALKKKEKIRPATSPIPSGRRATVSGPSKPASPLSLLSQTLMQETRSTIVEFSPRPTLTPAGAVAQAYKQQEQKQGNDAKPQTPPNTEAGDTGEEVAATPYYTVVGNIPGRVVAAGGPDDKWDDLDSRLPCQQATPLKPGSGGRSISRKVSNRWKRMKNGGVEQQEHDGRHEQRGRRSLQEYRPLGSSKEQRGSADRFTGGDPELSSTGDLHPHQGLPSVPNGGSERGKESSKRESTVKERGEEGSKLWKLMKRISTSGIRDRYHAEEAAPPVPPIPKDLLQATTTHFSTERQPDTLTRIMTSPYRTASSHMSTPTSKPKSVIGRRPSTAPKSFGMHRASSTTRSSSPMSSDVASTTFFNRSQSVRSSTSSYGGEFRPPLPNFLDQHILSPNELHQFDYVPSSPTFKSRNHVPTRTGSNPADGRTFSLPCPPRRVGGNEKDCISSPSRPTSPTIPSFSAAGPVNAFPPKNFKDGDKSLNISVRLPEFGQSPAPPKPTTSTCRLPGCPATSPSQGAEGDEMKRSNRNRASSASHSDGTRTQGPRSNSISTTPRINEPPSATSPLTFREIGAAHRAPLSEKEKADKWDDLLERSDRAGGTLHLGGGNLMSDQLRFSNYSEMS